MVFAILDHYYLLEYVKLLLLLARIASLPALLMMVCLAIAGAYQSSQGNSSENDPNNTTVSGPFFSQKGDLGILVTLSFIILQ